MSVAFGEQRFGTGASPLAAAPGLRDLERQYHVVLQDSLGHPALGFRDGIWFRLTVSGPQPLQLRGAIRYCPHAAGSIVQIACWWMRENPLQPRALDLATELALTVGELVRVCPADGLGTTSHDLAPLAMMAVAPQAAPPMPDRALPPQHALPPAPTRAAPAPVHAAPTPAHSAPAPVYSAPAPPPTGSWFDPSDTSTGGFPAIPPAPVMPPPTYVSNHSAASNQSAVTNHYQQPGLAEYPPAPNGYGTSPAPQIALPAALPAAPSYEPRPQRQAQPVAQRPAQPAARGYSTPGAHAQQTSQISQGSQMSQGSESSQTAMPQRPIPRSQPQGQQAQGQPQLQPRQPSAQPPRPRPQQQQRPEFRDERRDTFERRLGLEEGGAARAGLDRSGDRGGLDRSSDRNPPVQPRRPAGQQPRGTMGQRPATRPRRPSDS